MTDQQRYEKLLTLIGDDFAQSLAEWYRQKQSWTERQRIWVVRKTDPQPEQPTRQRGTLTSPPPKYVHLCTLFELPRLLIRAIRGRKTGASLYFANLLNTHGGNGDLSIKWSVSGNCWWIADGAGKLYGKINENGEVWATKDWEPAIAFAIDEIEADPIGFVGRWGRQTNQCVFCAAPLTDPKSVEKGWGPICAGHYNLPWGKRKVRELVAV